MKTVGLIAAMSMESQALLRMVKEPKRIKLGQFKGYRFQLPLWDCVLVECGWGMFRAEEATRVLVDQVHPTLLISFGIAGAVEEDLNIGDVVCAENHFLLQNGSILKKKASSSLSPSAQKMIEKALKPNGARLYSGATVTTHGSQLIPKNRKTLVHPVLEMETAGIMKGIAGTGIPLISLRGISDGPQAPIPFDLEAMVDENYHMQMGKVLLAILKRPAILAQALKMSKNSQLAASNEAIATLAALELETPIQSPE
jgi:nucleoside phosphorylase